MTQVFGSVHDFPRFEVLRSVQDFIWPEVHGSVRDFPKATKSLTLPFLPGRKPCPVASLAGKQVMPCSAFAGQKLGARGYMALQGLITRAFPR